MNHCSAVLWSELYCDLRHLDPKFSYTMASHWLQGLPTASTLLKASSAASGGTTWSVLETFISTRDTLRMTIMHIWLVKVWVHPLAHITNWLHHKLCDELNTIIYTLGSSIHKQVTKATKVLGLLHACNTGQFFWSSLRAEHKSYEIAFKIEEDFSLYLAILQK